MVNLRNKGMKSLSFQSQQRHKRTVIGVGSHNRDADSIKPFISTVVHGPSVFPSVTKKIACVAHMVRCSHGAFLIQERHTRWQVC